jgi:hypothetical protein
LHIRSPFNKINVLRSVSFQEQFSEPVKLIQNPHMGANIGEKGTVSATRRMFNKRIMFLLFSTTIGYPLFIKKNMYSAGVVIVKIMIIYCSFLPQQVRCELYQMHERLAQVLLKPTAAVKQPPIQRSPGQRFNVITAPTVAAPQQCVWHCDDASNVVQVKIKPKKLSSYRPVLVADPGASFGLAGIQQWHGCSGATGDEKVTLLVRIPDVAEGWVTIMPLTHLLAYCKQTNQQPPTPAFYRGRFGSAGKEMKPLPGRLVVQGGGLAWLTLTRGEGRPASLYAPGGTLVAVCQPALKPPPPPLERSSVVAEAEAEASYELLPAEKVDHQV